jgi:hypothetical protein
VKCSPWKKYFIPAAYNKLFIRAISAGLFVFNIFRIGLRRQAVCQTDITICTNVKLFSVFSSPFWTEHILTNGKYLNYNACVNWSHNVLISRCDTRNWPRVEGAVVVRRDTGRMTGALTGSRGLIDCMTGDGSGAGQAYKWIVTISVSTSPGGCFLPRRNENRTRPDRHFAPPPRRPAPSAGR